MNNREKHHLANAILAAALARYIEDGHLQRAMLSTTDSSVALYSDYDAMLEHCMRLVSVFSDRAAVPEGTKFTP